MLNIYFTFDEHLRGNSMSLRTETVMRFRLGIKLSFKACTDLIQNTGLLWLERI